MSAMTSFKHDNQGFLVGELLELNRELLASQDSGLTVLRRIRNDVAAISRAVGANVRGGRGDWRTSVPGAVAQPAGRGVPAQRSNAGTGNTASAARRGAAAPGMSPTARAAVVALGRDTAGRFVSTKAKAGRELDLAVGARVATPAGTRATPSQAAGPSGRDARGRFQGGGSPDFAGTDVVGKIAATLGRIDASLGSANQLDPAIMAAHEIRDAVSPLGRGLFGLLGRNAERRKERWYSRILKALTGRKGGVSAASGDGSGGFSLSLGGGGLAGMLGGLLGLGKGAFKGAGRLLRRVPLLGALLAGGGALASVFGGDDPTKTADENRADRYRGVGGALGTGAGGAVGAALGSLLGPVGTVLGGVLGSMLGEIVGEKVGEWTKTLIDADIPGKIGKAWEGFTSLLKDGWSGLTEKARDLGNKANEAVKNATGVDVKKTAQDAAAKAAEVATAAKEKAAEVGAKAMDVAKKGATAAGDFVAENAPKLVPNTVKKLAGIGSNAALMLKEGVEAGMGPRELANFMGQNAHESSNFTTLRENLNYSAAGLRKTFGKYYKTDAEAQADARNPEAIANKVYGGRMGNAEPGDGWRFRGRGFTQLTGRDNYTAASKALGIDLVNNPDMAADPAVAAKVSAWYWRTRVSSRGAGEDVAKATRAVNGGVIGLEDRIKKTAEWESKIAGLEGGGAGVKAATVSAAMPPVAAVSIPMSAPDKIPAAPDVAIPALLNSRPQAVSVSLRDPVGQDVGDRKIAHIVSGGLGGA